MRFTRLKCLVDQAKFKARIWRTLRSAPPGSSRPDRIIIDLGHCCDLSCRDCNRSCGADQAPADEFISLEQIRRFVAESIAAGRRWRRIMLEGGEPTLHPQIDGILAELQRYRLLHAPDCEIELCSNGHNPRARRILGRLPRGIRAKNSAKSAERPKRHFGFNIAPVDLNEFAGADYGQGCYIQRIFGLGLTRSGYYPHPICGGIDRVFGFDIGLKSLPAANADMSAQMVRLCPFCGHFREFRGAGHGLLGILKGGADNGFSPGHKSPSWTKAYRDYRKNRPRLSLY
ncbi:MAG: radical SAM protein [Candidatus Aminicenantes bacterium]|nr:radical SAM protein [Candidatus Aminicenantes bacterium]